MGFDWSDFLNKLRKRQIGTHRIREPCLPERLKIVQRELGQMPVELTEMLAHFNGAQLCCGNSPFVSIFGVTESVPVPPFEWAPDWYIDKFTPVWRVSQERCTDWVIGMTNYGGLIVLDDRGIVREWDTSQNIWSPGEWTFTGWIEEIVHQGEECIEELRESESRRD